ncbi:metalloregulator ArsR/SmtB family transcription factor [Microbacterium sp. C448]|uniref:metalloregulator ArsR/SmtB family transcription factor n=1 Tax=Microbacterium sp. C448 TaxID=1177594 RepID=UPI0009E0AF74|nr:metalloregulator ArsR/SmtB family transcription factor [Microbacterium sp. C448]
MSVGDGSGEWTILGDPTRARIVRLIRDSPDGRALVGRLAEALGLRQPTVSHHMKELTARGIVARQPEGRRVWYSLDPRNAERVDALLGADSPGPRVELDLPRIIDRLTERYRGTFSRETIERYVTESHDLMSANNPTTLIGSRTAAFATGRLDALARSNAPRGAVPEVLFVCVENAGRSQLAAGILRQLAGDRVMVRTAGSAPAGAVRTTVVAALDEIGVSLGGEFPKPLTDEAVRAADVVVTMGCGDACPVYPGRRYLDWDLEDPVGKSLETVRGIRDDIESRVRELLVELASS